MATIRIYSFYGDIVSGGGSDWGNIKGEGVSPPSSGDIFTIGEILVVYKGTKEAALEVDVVHKDVLDEETTEVEVDSVTKLGWIGVAVGLGFVQDEPGLVISLGELHAVRHDGVKGEVDHGLDKGGFVIL